MNFRVENITPEKARKYLEGNLINRSVKERRVLAYAEDMKKGAWQLNGESIRFDKNGRLIDGQHRLLAVIKAQVAVPMVITTDVDEDITIFDRGVCRSVTDSLQLEGVDRSIANSDCVAIAKLYYTCKGKIVISDSTVKDFIIKHKESLIFARSITSNRGGTASGRISIKNASIGLALMTAFEQNFDKNKLLDWASIVKDGFMESLYDSAAIVFRNDLISGAVNYTSGSTSRIKATYQAEKSIQDFCDRKKRRQSYVNWDSPVYSNYREE